MTERGGSLGTPLWQKNCSVAATVSRQKGTLAHIAMAELVYQWAATPLPSPPFGLPRDQRGTGLERQRRDGAHRYITKRNKVRKFSAKYSRSVTLFRIINADPTPRAYSLRTGSRVDEQIGVVLLLRK